MKILLILALVFVGFVVAANAQVCGQYRTTLIIKDKLDQPIGEAEIKIVPFPIYNYAYGKGFIRDEKDASHFVLTISERDIVRGKYKVIVSAKGYFPAKKEIEFPFCGQQEFTIKLTKKNVKGKK